MRVLAGAFAVAALIYAISSWATTASSFPDNVKVGRGPGDFLTAGFGSLWVPNTGDGTVSRLQLETGRLQATIRVSPTPQIPARGPHASPFSIAAARTSLWVSRVVHRRFSLVRIDPRSQEIAQVIGLHDFAYGLAANDERLWVTQPYANRLLEISARTGTVVASVEVAEPFGVARAGSTIWVASHRGAELIEYSAGLKHRLRRVKVPPDVETIEICESRLWAASGAGFVTEVDLANHSVVSIPVGGDPYTVSCDTDTVWAGTFEARTLIELDPNRHIVQKTLKMPGPVNGVRVAAGRVWATSITRARVEVRDARG